MRLLLDACALIAIGQGDRMAPEAMVSLRAALRAGTVSVPAVAAALFADSAIDPLMIAR